MASNKIAILAIGAVVIVAGVVLVAGFLKKGTTNLPQLINKNAQVSVGTDICAEFPKEWVQSVLGKTIIKTEAFSMNGSNNCKYFIDETNAAVIKLENLTIANQKTGQVALGRTIKTDSKIKMENVVAWQPDGLINEIYLVLNPNRYVAIDRTSAKVYDNEGEIAFAIKVAERIQSGKNQIAAVATPTPQAQVPLPQGTDIVRNFFNLIAEGRIPDAIAMMTPSAVPDENAKQAWGVQFNAFKKITVKNVEPSGENTYKVTLDVLMKPEAANVQPMPYYGWGDGEFVRWISLEKVNNVWKVVGIATGP
jgi:hypothetical protein